MKNFRLYIHVDHLLIFERIAANNRAKAVRIADREDISAVQYSIDVESAEDAFYLGVEFGVARDKFEERLLADKLNAIDHMSRRISSQE